uniref:Uncharacterized protein n=1 Tax=Mastacembelus armatus TaxID=205130 RepID=A0A7N8X054_9TELE
MQLKDITAEDLKILLELVNISIHVTPEMNSLVCQKKKKTQNVASCLKFAKDHLDNLQHY